MKEDLMTYGEIKKRIKECQEENEPLSYLISFIMHLQASAYHIGVITMKRANKKYLRGKP